MDETSHGLRGGSLAVGVVSTRTNSILGWQVPGVWLRGQWWGLMTLSLLQGSEVGGFGVGEGQHV